MKRKQPILPFSQIGMVFLVWFAFLFLIIFLTACSSDTVKRSLPPSRGVDALAYQVELRTQEEAVSAEDGTALASCSYQLPVMSVLRADGTAVTAADAAEEEKAALSHADTFNQAFTRWAEDADFPALADTAREDYAWRTQMGELLAVPYQQTLDCTCWQTDSLVSISGMFYYYGGGPHPNRVYLGWNFDTRSGTFPTAGQFFSDVDAVAAELVRQAEDKAREWGMEPGELFWPDYQSTLGDWSENAAVSFDGQSMTVAYSPYDLASYAAGEQIFTIPLSFLDPILNGYGRELLGRE